MRPAPFVHMKKDRFTFHAYLKEGTHAPTTEETYTGQEWVSFGLDNLFPQAIGTLRDNCVPLGRCWSMATAFIAGKGVKFYDREGEEIEAAQERFQQWMLDSSEEEFLHATASDIALGLSKAWVVRRAFGGSIARLDHLDVSRLRAGHLQSGKVKDYFWSADWSRCTDAGEKFKPVKLPAFDITGKRSKSVLYTKTYKQGRDHYSEPWFLPIVPDCEVWIKVPAFNKTQIDTGFRPSVHLHTFISGDTKDLEQYDKDIEDAYTGATGRGIFHTFGTTEEGAPTLTSLPRGDHAGELDTMRDNAEKVIIRGYGVPDILYRMDTAGGLSSQGSALKAAVDQFMNGFVIPMQQIITRDLVRLMNADGLVDVWEARIEQLELFREEGVSDDLKLQVMTRDEIREELDLPELGGEKGEAIPGEKKAAPDPKPMPAKKGAADTKDEETPEDDGVL